MPQDSLSDLQRLAYERAVWLLEHQRVRVMETRTNSSILIAATALVASFLGKWSLDKGEGSFAAIALAAFVLGVLCGIAPLWPVIVLPTAGARGLLSRIIPAPIADRLLKETLVWHRGPNAKDILAMKPATALGTLALEFTKAAEVNDMIIRRRSAWVILCGVCLAAQVLLWIGNAIVAD